MGRGHSYQTILSSLVFGTLTRRWNRQFSESFSLSQKFAVSRTPVRPPLVRSLKVPFRLAESLDSG